MRTQLWGAVAVVAVWVTPAAAVHTEKYPVPYFGAAVEQLVTESAREAGSGEGFQLSVGVPLESGTSAVEVRFFDLAIKDRSPDGKKDYQTGVFVDYVLDFGPMGAAPDGGFLSGITPFVSAGVGFLQEDVLDDKHVHFGLSAGGGLLMPLGWKGWAARFDARIQPQMNDKSVPNEDFLIDYAVNLGLQIPLTWFFDRPVPVDDAQDCPLAVVDPATGRRDCAADGDGDGVGDARDECPGTAAGTAVDRKGCPTAASSDNDGDGVANASDKCPGTQPGLQVDGDGCVVAQKTSIRGVTFEPNSALLTAEGRTTLEGVAATLAEQKDLKVEIAGHTDSVGSKAFNTLLSQQRADAVRAFLVEKGIEEGRMTAVGYGELEPVDTNETDEGRQANRRVEFRISTD